MSSRRAHLAALGLVAATAPIIPSAVAVRARPAAQLELNARRTKINLPDVPTLGLPYITLLDLFDSDGTPVGKASAGSFVINVTTEGPVVLGFVVLQLGDGDIHYQRIIRRHGGYPRTAVGAITGGTGQYTGAGGHVDVAWPDADRVDLVVNLA